MRQQAKRRLSDARLPERFLRLGPGHRNPIPESICLSAEQKTIPGLDLIIPDSPRGCQAQFGNFLSTVEKVFSFIVCDVVAGAVPSPFVGPDNAPDAVHLVFLSGCTTVSRFVRFPASCLRRILFSGASGMLPRQAAKGPVVPSLPCLPDTLLSPYEGRIFRTATAPRSNTPCSQTGTA